MAKLAAALRTDSLADVDLRQLAQMLRKKGRGRDTVLAHITPQEARLLKRRGGRGSINPKTGLPEFEDDFYDYGGGDFGGYDYGGGGDYGPIYEYYDEPAQDYGGAVETGGAGADDIATTSVDDGEGRGGEGPQDGAASPTTTAEQQAQDARRTADIAAIGQGGAAPPAAVDPSLLDSDGNPILPPDPDSPEATASRNDFLGQLFGSGGLGGLFSGGVNAASLARLLAAGGAGATALRAGEAARNDAAAARNDINAVANNARQAGDVAQVDYNKLAETIRNSGNVAKAETAALASGANTRAGEIQTGLGNIGAASAARAAEVQRQYNALASPYQTQGREMAQMGLTGGLTPASAQAFQAAQARLAQQGIGRGGVAAAQSATQLESLRAQLLGDQYRQGIETQQIGDRYAAQGISAGLAQSNVADVLNANALRSGLAQYNYGDTLSTSAISAGTSADRAAASLSAAGISAALQAAGISDRYTIQAIMAGLAGNREANTAMQGFWSQIGNFLGGGTGASAGNAAAAARI